MISYWHPLPSLERGFPPPRDSRFLKSHGVIEGFQPFLMEENLFVSPQIILDLIEFFSGDSTSHPHIFQHFCLPVHSLGGACFTWEFTKIVKISWRFCPPPSYKYQKHFLQASKTSKNINFIFFFFFASLKNLKRHEFHFLQAQKTSKKHEFHFLQA